MWFSKFEIIYMHTYVYISICIQMQTHTYLLALPFFLIFTLLFSIINKVSTNKETEEKLMN